MADDWGSADVHAIAWVNDTLADDLRVAMDEFMAELDPNNGDDGWISTDEREVFRALASECIEYTLTRIGIRDGPPHRGGVGVDWKNTTWEEDGVVIEEFNIIPSRHSQIRDCTSAFGNDCEEVPIIPDEDRDCDTDVPASQGVDECRIKLWLNATMVISGFTDNSNFTLALNASNMSGATLDFTFPVTQDLRLDLWDECEGRGVGLDEDTAGGQAPLRGSCIGDGSSTYEITENADGSLTYSLSPDSPRTDWPIGEDLFADFTTAPIPVDNPPQWTDAAPPEGAWFPSPSGGQHVWAPWGDVSSWFADEGSVSQLDVRCTGAASACGASHHLVRSTAPRGIDSSHSAPPHPAPACCAPLSAAPDSGASLRCGSAHSAPPHLWAQLACASRPRFRCSATAAHLTCLVFLQGTV